MPTVDLTFNNNINVSVQVGDIIYFTPTTLNGVHNTAGTILELGSVVSIYGNTIVANYTSGQPIPSVSDFIMFAKDRSVNMSSLLGYFAKFRVKNNSTAKAEMYTISAEVIESSK